MLYGLAVRCSVLTIFETPSRSLWRHCYEQRSPWVGDILTSSALLVWWLLCNVYSSWYDAGVAVIFFNYWRLRMVVADGLAPIWRQGICKHHDGESRSVRLGNPNLIHQPRGCRRPDCSFISSLKTEICHEANCVRISAGKPLKQWQHSFQMKTVLPLVCDSVRSLELYSALTDKNSASGCTRILWTLGGHSVKECRSYVQIRIVTSGARHTANVRSTDNES